MSARRRIATVAAVSAALLGVSLPAWAYFTATATSTVSAGGISLVAVTSPTASDVDATSASVSWMDAKNPNTTTYVVTSGSTTYCPAVTFTAQSCSPSGLAPNTSYTFTITPKLQNWTGPAAVAPAITTAATATKLVFTTQPSGAVATIPFTRQPIVKVEDSQGNVVTTSTAPVTLSIKTGTGTTGAALNNCSATTTNGVASFSGCTIDKPGGGYTLTASSGGLTSATSTSFTVDALPTITSPSSASPASVKQGNTASFTVTGTGFQTGIKVSFSGGLTVNSITVTNSGSLSVSVTAGNGSQKSTYDLTVTNPDGGSATSVNSVKIS